jgi:hypothetical protein
VGRAERFDLQVLDAALTEVLLGDLEQRRAEPAHVALRPDAHHVDLGRRLRVQLEREEAVAAGGERR